MEFQFSIQMEFMLVEPECCCCVDIDVVDDGDFFAAAAAVVVALSFGIYDKQEPTNVFADKPKLYTKELNKWILWKRTEAQSYAAG